MLTRRFRPGLILVAGGIVALLALNVSLAAAQVPIRPNVTITPPQPMAAIEFVQEAGVERWEVKLSGGKYFGEKAYLRITGNSCTHMEEVYKGMITPLYEDMTFKTRNGKTCTVQAIER
jgi:hypothetical protein